MPLGQRPVVDCFKSGLASKRTVVPSLGADWKTLRADLGLLKTDLLWWSPNFYFRPESHLFSVFGNDLKTVTRSLKAVTDNILNGDLGAVIIGFEATFKDRTTNKRRRVCFISILDEEALPLFDEVLSCTSVIINALKISGKRVTLLSQENIKYAILWHQEGVFFLYGLSLILQLNIDGTSLKELNVFETLVYGAALSQSREIRTSICLDCMWKSIFLSLVLHYNSAFGQQQDEEEHEACGMIFDKFVEGSHSCEMKNVIGSMSKKKNVPVVSSMPELANSCPLFTLFYVELFILIAGLINLLHDMAVGKLRDLSLDVCDKFGQPWVTLEKVKSNLLYSVHNCFSTNSFTITAILDQPLHSPTMGDRTRLSRNDYERHGQLVIHC